MSSGIQMLRKRAHTVKNVSEKSCLFYRQHFQPIEMVEAVSP
jgi:hypothetical protein